MNSFFIYLRDHALVPAITAIGLFVLWLVKGGRRREGVEVKKVDIEGSSLSIDNTIKVNKYLFEENDLLKQRYSFLEKELEKQSELNKQQKKLIADLDEEIRLLKIRQTLWVTLNH